MLHDLLLGSESIIPSMSNNPTSPRGLTCNACRITFPDVPQQRAHMKQPWHVLNLKRQLEDLEPVAEPHGSQSISKPTADRQPSKNLSDDIEPVPQLERQSSNVRESISHCLFCAHDSEDIDACLTHMKQEHSFFIPESSRLTDTESFVSYLRGIILIHYECLFCATIRSTVEGVRQHMREKGHCKLNFEVEPELGDFWDTEEASGEQSLLRSVSAGSEELGAGDKRHEASDAEKLLPSGKLIGSRSSQRVYNQPRPRYDATRSVATKSESNSLIVAGKEDPPHQDSRTSVAAQKKLTVSRRGMGVAGLSDQTKRALFATQKKAQKQEQLTEHTFRWSVEKMANKQKRYRITVAKKGCVPMNSHLI